MYNEHFGFKERPFKLLPNPEYLYISHSHKSALSHLTYTFSEGDGLIAIIGEAGTGKTTLCRAFFEKLGDHSEVAYIFNPKLSVTDLLKSIFDEFDIKIPDNSTTNDLFDVLNRILIKKKAAGKHAMLIIDEAQNLSCKVLEQIRLLSNLETNRSKLLQIVLVGQPELNDLLNTNELRQLKQRISIICKLTPLAFEDTVRYIQHRIQTAGRKESVLFTGPAMQKIHSFSKGIPRLINTVCDRSLLIAFVSGSETVDENSVTAAIQEMLPARQKLGRLRRIETKKTLALVCMLCIAVTLTLIIWPTDSKDTPKETAQKEYTSGQTVSKITLADPDDSKPLYADTDKSPQLSARGAAVPETETRPENKNSVPEMDDGHRSVPEEIDTKTKASESAPTLQAAAEKPAQVPAGAPAPEPSHETASEAAVPPSPDPPAKQGPAGEPAISEKPVPQKSLAMLEKNSRGPQETQPATVVFNESTSAADKKNMDRAKSVTAPDIVESTHSSPPPEKMAANASAADSGTSPAPRSNPDSTGKPSGVASGKPDLSGQQTTSAEMAAEPEETPPEPNDSEFGPSPAEPEYKTVLASVPRPTTALYFRPDPESPPSNVVDRLSEKQTDSVQKTAEKPPAPASDNGDGPGTKPASQHADGGVQPDAAFKPNEVDTKPKLIRGDSPQYPPIAQRKNVKGWVILQFVVNTRGLVEDVRVLEAEPEGIFDKAALETAESYKFKPAEKNGKAVNCILKQRIRFKLN
jgi:TonB family protein